MSPNASPELFLAVSQLKLSKQEGEPKKEAENQSLLFLESLETRLGSFVQAIPVTWCCPVAGKGSSSHVVVCFLCRQFSCLKESSGSSPSER